MGEAKEIVFPQGPHNATNAVNNDTNISKETGITHAGPFASFDSYSSSSDESDESGSSGSTGGQPGACKERDEQAEHVGIFTMNHVDAWNDAKRRNSPGEKNGADKCEGQRKLNGILSQKRSHDGDYGEETNGKSDSHGAVVAPSTSRHRPRKRVRFSDGSVPGQPISPLVFAPTDTMFHYKLPPDIHQSIGSTITDSEDLRQTTTPATEPHPDSLLRANLLNVIETENEEKSDYAFDAEDKTDYRNNRNNGLSSVPSEDFDDNSVKIQGGIYVDDNDDEAALNELDQLLAKEDMGNATSSQGSTKDHRINDESDIRLAELDDEREQLAQRELEQRVSHLRQRLFNVKKAEDGRDCSQDNPQTGRQIATKLVDELVADLIPGERFDASEVKGSDGSRSDWIVPMKDKG